MMRKGIKKITDIFYTRETLEYGLFIFGLILTYLSSLYSYLLFHSIAELFSIIIAGSIFLIGWNSRKYIENSFFLVLGISFIFVGIIDLIHTLAYSGMGVFIGFTSNLTTQLWISARYIQVISFLFAIFVINKKLNADYLMIIYMIIDTLLLIFIFQGIFPDCYIEGLGLTSFKVVSEYIIDIILLLCLGLLIKFREEFNKKVFNYLVIFILATIISEIAFTFYISVFDFSNFLGHIFKIVAFFFMYKAIIEIGLENPFQLLFRKLKVSEESLREQTIQLKLTHSEIDQIFNAALPLRIVNSNFKIINVNETFCNLFNANKESLIGKHCYELFPHASCHTDRCTLKKIIAGENNVEYEISLLSANGSNIPLIVHSVPLKSLEGEFLGIIQNYTDMTEEKIIQENLIKSEKKYRYLIENSLEGVWVIDKEAKTTLTNPAMAEMLGYSVEDMIGHSLFDYMDEEQRLLGQNMFKRRSEGIKEDHNFIFSHRSGRKIYTSLRTSPLYDDHGNFNGAMAFVTDITEQKLAQEKIIDVAKFPLESPDPVLRVSKKYVLFTNKAAERIFNIGEGSRIPEILLKSVKACFTEDKNVEVEITVNNETFSIFIVPIKGAGYVNIYGKNISKRKQVERELEQFVSTVSHELRTPISVLIMSLDYLSNYKDYVTQETYDKLQEGIKKNIYLLRDLVEDILTLSRIDEKKTELEWEEYHPYDIFTEIIDLMKPIAREKNIAVEVSIDQNISLNGDPKKIDQIYRIFIDNAIKYSKSDSTIEIKAIDNYIGDFNKDNQKGVLIQFKDNGIGILNEELPHIFERFFRSEQVTDIPGTGLGLSIAERLIELHSGSVYVESEYEKGSTFSLFFPKIERKP